MPSQPEEARARRRAADVVRLTGVAQRLGGRWALRGVSLRLRAGELVAVIGHNGSGKTTLLRVISTSLRPTRGEGSVLGHDLCGDPDAVRRAVAMLTSSGGMYADLTAAENLTFVLRMLGERADDNRVIQALGWAGLRSAADARVRTFSSGMQRRLALAGIRLRRAQLLLMDEPYNNLDPAGASLVDELLADVHARGGSAVVVIHDVERSGAHFDRVVELHDGRIAGDGQLGLHAPRVALMGAS